MSEKSSKGSESGKRDSISKNERLLISYLKKVSSNDEAKYLEATGRMAKWLHSERAYYKDAQSYIAIILENARNTLWRLNPENISDLSGPGPQSLEARRLAYRNLLQTVIPHLRLFVDPEDRKTLIYLASQVGFPVMEEMEEVPEASGSNVTIEKQRKKLTKSLNGYHHSRSTNKSSPISSGSPASFGHSPIETKHPHSSMSPLTYTRVRLENAKSPSLISSDPPIVESLTSNETDRLSSTDVEREIPVPVNESEGTLDVAPSSLKLGLPESGQVASSLLPNYFPQNSEPLKIQPKSILVTENHNADLVMHDTTEERTISPAGNSTNDTSYIDASEKAPINSLQSSAAQKSSIARVAEGSEEILQRISTKADARSTTVSRENTAKQNVLGRTLTPPDKRVNVTSVSRVSVPPDVTSRSSTPSQISILPPTVNYESDAFSVSAPVIPSIQSSSASNQTQAQSQFGSTITAHSTLNPGPVSQTQQAQRPFLLKSFISPNDVPVNPSIIHTNLPPIQTSSASPFSMQSPTTSTTPTTAPGPSIKPRRPALPSLGQKQSSLNIISESLRQLDLRWFENTKNATLRMGSYPLGSGDAMTANTSSIQDSSLGHREGSAESLSTVRSSDITLQPFLPTMEQSSEPSLQNRVRLSSPSVHTSPNSEKPLIKQELVTLDFLLSRGPKTTERNVPDESTMVIFTEANNNGMDNHIPLVSTISPGRDDPSQIISLDNIDKQRRSASQPISSTPSISLPQPSQPQVQEDFSSGPPMISSAAPTIDQQNILNNNGGSSYEYSFIPPPIPSSSSSSTINRTNSFSTPSPLNYDSIQDNSSPSISGLGNQSHSGPIVNGLSTVTVSDSESSTLGAQPAAVESMAPIFEIITAPTRALKRKLSAGSEELDHGPSNRQRTSEGQTPRANDLFQLSTSLLNELQSVISSSGSWQPPLPPVQGPILHRINGANKDADYTIPAPISTTPLSLYGPATTVIIAARRGVKGGGGFTIDFPIDYKLLNRLNFWNKRNQHSLDVSASMCISLGCYKIIDNVEAWSTLGEDSIRKLVSCLSSRWPKNYGLRAHIRFGSSSAPIRVNFGLAHSAVWTVDGFVDISPFIVEEGHVFINMEHTADMSDYFFILLAHHPTINQLRQLTERRNSDETWRAAVNRLQRPLIYQNFKDHLSEHIASLDV